MITYPGIERPTALVFGETPQPGFVFSPVADRSRRFDADVLTKGVRRLLAPIDSRLTLHSLRHTFATWRLMIGDPLLPRGHLVLPTIYPESTHPRYRQTTQMRRKCWKHQ